MSLLPSSARRNSGQRGAPHPLSAALSVLRGLRLRRLARSRLRPLGRLGVGLRLRPRLLRRARLRRHARCQLGALPERLPYPLTRAPGARDDSRTAVRKPARTRCTSRASTASTVPEERANGGTLCAGRCRSSDGAGGVGAGRGGRGRAPAPRPRSAATPSRAARAQTPRGPSRRCCAAPPLQPPASPLHRPVRVAHPVISSHGPYGETLNIHPYTRRNSSS